MILDAAFLRDDLLFRASENPEFAACGFRVLIPAREQQPPPTGLIDAINRSAIYRASSFLNRSVKEYGVCQLDLGRKYAQNPTGSIKNSCLALFHIRASERRKQF